MAVMTMAVPPRRGSRFEHARQLDTSWQPGPGQRYTDAPHVVMVVTRVARSLVWYRPETQTTGAGFVVGISKLSNVVRRWLP